MYENKGDHIGEVCSHLKAEVNIFLSSNQACFKGNRKLVLKGENRSEKKVHSYTHPRKYDTDEPDRHFGMHCIPFKNKLKFLSYLCKAF